MDIRTEYDQHAHVASRNGTRGVHADGCIYNGWIPAEAVSSGQQCKLGAFANLPHLFSGSLSPPVSGPRDLLEKANKAQHTYKTRNHRGSRVPTRHFYG